MDESETDDPTLIGEECHIVANATGGPRGQNELPHDKRNLYGNLILLCRNHHKIIDDNPNEYTVAKLHEIKREHEEWVLKNIAAYDEQRQRDDEYYASIVERWEQDCDVDNWENWSSWVFGAGQPRIRVKVDDALFGFRRWIFSRVWPGRYPSLERAFFTFRVVLQDFQETFRKHAETNQSGDWLWTKKFYKIDRWDEELYHCLARQFDFHVVLVQDLMLELSRAAN